MDKDFIDYRPERFAHPMNKQPSVKTMEKWMDTGVAKATDGCKVEPDGHCEHGKPSWLILLGLI